MHFLLVALDGKMVATLVFFSCRFEPPSVVTHRLCSHCLELGPGDLFWEPCSRIGTIGPGYTSLSFKCQYQCMPKVEV